MSISWRSFTGQSSLSTNGAGYARIAIDAFDGSPRSERLSVDELRGLRDAIQAHLSEQEAKA